MKLLFIPIFIFLSFTIFANTDEKFVVPVTTMKDFKGKYLKNYFSFNGSIKLEKSSTKEISVVQENSTSISFQLLKPNLSYDYITVKLKQNNEIRQIKFLLSYEDGSSERPYTIHNPEALQAINADATNLASSYILANNIDLSKIPNWTPIGSDKKPFNGNFNGQGYKITGLNVDSKENFAGLFGKIKQISEDSLFIQLVQAVTKNSPQKKINITTIKNLHIEGSVKGNEYAGLVGGHLENTIIENVSVAGKVSGKIAGGIAGLINKNIRADAETYVAYIKSSHSSASVTATTQAGGLVANVSTIYSCSATGDVYCTSCTYAGGLAAISHVIDKSYATGNVYCKTEYDYQSYAGGLAGSAYTIEKSFSSGNVTGCLSAAGLSPSTQYVNYSYTLGNIKAKNAGGLGGHNINESYSTGQVDSTGYHAGTISADALSIESTVSYNCDKVSIENQGSPYSCLTYSSPISDKNNYIISDLSFKNTKNAKVMKIFDNTIIKWNSDVWDFTSTKYPLLKDIPLNVQINAQNR